MKFEEWWEKREASLAGMSPYVAAGAAWEAAAREAISIANGVKKNADATLKRSGDSHAQGMSFASDCIARRVHEGMDL